MPRPGCPGRRENRVPLRPFHSRDERVALNAETERLRSLLPADLAAEIMPAFGPDGKFGGDDLNVLMICNWLLRAHSGHGVLQLRDRATAALHLLEDSGLIENLSRARTGAGAARLRATPLGREALASGTVRERLGAGRG
jgi:hypothetical protein